MKQITAAQFREQCLALLDEVDPDGIVLTKRGKPVAKLIPFANRFRAADRVAQGQAPHQRRHPVDGEPVGC